jgi:poly-gamma-glutamate synthesis protein (capsule biosynthesis protein)
MGSNNSIRLFLAGDVMTGRGIDQILPHPSHHRIYEPYVCDATEYLALAEQANGPIPKGVDFSYIWGDGLAALQEMAPDLRIINLETAVTQSDDYWHGKGINYRMHPRNIPCISAAAIDCCVLANNHVLDWGYAGLSETLQSLRAEGMASAGAGETIGEAGAPVIMEVSGKGRVVLFAFGHYSSGVEHDWGAGKKRAGINVIEKLTSDAVREIASQVASVKRENDVVVFSIHWGGNWGYSVTREQREFAHRLIDEAGVDLIHGHSSHHPKGIEVYREKLILYGCGDLLNDYEGIGGYESYRDDLSLMHFSDIDPTSGRLLSLSMVPQQIRNFRLNHVTDRDAKWLAAVLRREGKKYGTRVELEGDNHLLLRW